jgi:L-ribulose-5-phosphate 3-epimerase
MNRREFLKVGAVACVASAPATAAWSGPLSGKIKKAVKFHMIAEDLNVLDKLKLLRDVGFDGVEIRTADKVDRQEVADAIEATGFPVHGIINASSANVSKAIDLAKLYGGTSVLIVAAEDPKRSYDENFGHWQQLIRSAVAHAEENQVRLLIENVRATFLKTAEEMARFIDQCDSPMVGSYFDVGNTITWTEQPPEHWARVLGSRIVKLDIKDRGHAEFGDPKRRSTTAIGTDGGEVHWANVRDELSRVGFAGWATAEVTGGDRERLAGIARWMDQVLGL